MPHALDLLTELGAETIEHPGGTLLAHLRRTAATLADWGADEPVRQAGLTHAAYGTDGFPAALLGLHERHRLSTAIGQEAEALVYLYASCDRAYTYRRLPRFRDRFTGQVVTPSRRALRAFMDITVANELDLLAHSPDLRQRHGEQLRAWFATKVALMSQAAAERCAVFFWTQ
ncbi:DUF6817 domain-containing protein [Nonomuraea typhae]|uniref:DUF6817 domain-containing protein n=1 Tax=Nonomuraea typhae TaxID=2603600 RepID=UPI0012F9EADB|nr:hypothetical protein [Nonomuraea typhae]